MLLQALNEVKGRDSIYFAAVRLALGVYVDRGMGVASWDKDDATAAYKEARSSSSMCNPAVVINKSEEDKLDMLGIDSRGGVQNVWAIKDDEWSKGQWQCVQWRKEKRSA